MVTPNPQDLPSFSLPKSAGRISWELWAGLAVAWLGALVSLVLLRHSPGLPDFLCPAFADCETVLTSRYAQFAGVPLPLAGGVFYLAILGLLLGAWATRSRSVRRRLLNAALWSVVAGATFSAGLMYLQFAVLRAFCPLCTLSALLIGGLVFFMARAARSGAPVDWEAAPQMAMILTWFALTTVALFSLPEGRFLSGRGARVWPMDLSTAQTAGPREAKVQVLVFSDFQCHFCRQLAPVLKRLREKYPQEIAVIFRHFPLETHPGAFPAAVAAECAGEQGAFWEYHDRLFAPGAVLNEAGFLSLAAALQLDQRRFSACLKSETVKKKVEASVREAIQGGLEGTPAVFLNGQRFEGPMDDENFSRQIRLLLTAPPAANSR